MEISVSEMGKYRHTVHNAEKYYNLTKDQGNAYWSVFESYLTACSKRIDQVARHSKEANPDEIDRDTLEGYKALHQALKHPAIKDHLTDSIAQLKTDLEDAISRYDYTAVDRHFDDFAARTKQGQHSFELVKLTEIDKTNPKFSLSNLSAFAYRIAGSIRFGSFISKGSL